MKTAIGYGLIILGVVSLSKYPDLGLDAADTFGALIGAGLFTFLPGILLIRSANKNKNQLP